MEQNTGLLRNTVDKYYTNKDVVSECMNFISTYIDFNKKDDLFIEPSAGNGSFIPYIKQISGNHIFYDIEPDHEDVIQQDYLSFDYESITSNKSYNQIHIVGNPPFGRQSSLAIKFIKKSALYGDTMSFILPKSFKKDSLKKHFPLNFHLAFEYDIPDNAFNVNNVTYNVPCVFQIWIKKDSNRVVPNKLLPNNFKFVKKDDDHDISFTRVGINAGNIDTVTDAKSIQSHYFIKFNKVLTDSVYKNIRNIQYDCKNNTVGPKSISKQELIKEFNDIIT
jgi:hypothetical protein